MDGHPKEEQILHAEEISEMLRPFLSGKKKLWPYSVGEIRERFRIELQEAGVTPAEESE